MTTESLFIISQNLSLKLFVQTDLSTLTLKAKVLSKAAVRRKKSTKLLPKELLLLLLLLFLARD